MDFAGYPSLSHISNSNMLLYPDSEYNFSTIAFPNNIWYRRASWDIGVKTTVLLLISLLGMLANGTILYAILNRRHLSAPINYFFASMAIADIATLVISPWLMLCRDVFQNYELGPIGCKIEGFFEFSFLMVDIFNLMAITFIRLVVIVFPHKQCLSRRRVTVALVISWMFGFSVASPLIAFRVYKERHWQNFLEKYCEEDSTVLPLYWNIIVTAMIWIPLAFMLLSYTIMFYNLESLAARSQQEENSRNAKFKKRAAIIIFAVVAVFILCRVPFTAVVFWRGILLQDQSPHTFGEDFKVLWFTANTLLFVNAAINPVIYGFTNRSFRKSLQKSHLVGWIFPKSLTPYKETSQQVWTVPKLTPRRLSGGRPAPVPTQRN